MAGQTSYHGMSEYARKYNKPDSERLGVFIEMPYLSEKYRRPVPKKKGLLSMLSGGPKTKCGNSDGYFDPFQRLFIGDKGNKPDKYASKLKSRGAFVPAGYPKKHACPGDSFGTFGGIIPAVSRKTRPVKRAKTTKGNPVTSPAKKGGPGYPNICLNKYPEYMPVKFRRWKTIKSDKPPMIPFTFPKPYFYPNPYVDPLKDPPSKRLYSRPKGPKKLQKSDFIPTGPAKWLGGCKAGCFEKWPEYRHENSFPKKKVHKVAFTPKSSPFMPQSWGDKTMSVYSILYKTNFSVNNTNYKTAKPVYVKHLLKTLY